LNGSFAPLRVTWW